MFWWLKFHDLCEIQVPLVERKISVWWISTVIQCLSTLRSLLSQHQQKCTSPSWGHQQTTLAAVREPLDASDWRARVYNRKRWCSSPRALSLCPASPQRKQQDSIKSRWPIHLAVHISVYKSLIMVIVQSIVIVIGNSITVLTGGSAHGALFIPSVNMKIVWRIPTEILQRV